jgi:hypothetical protein
VAGRADPGLETGFKPFVNVCRTALKALDLDLVSGEADHTGLTMHAIVGASSGPPPRCLPLLDAVAESRVGVQINTESDAAAVLGTMYSKEAVEYFNKLVGGRQTAAASILCHVLISGARA